MTSAARLLQLHGVIVDLIYQIEAVPPPGGEAQVHRFNMTPGGGFNAMVAARRSGLDVSYGGSVGSGPLGEIVRDALSAEGIAFVQPPDTARDQGCCTVMLDRTGERTSLASAGAEGHVSIDNLKHIALSDYDWSLLSGYTLYYDGSRAAFTHWLSSDVDIPKLVFDPAPVVGRIPRDALNAALARADWVSANLAEASILSGVSDPTEAARRLAYGRSGGAVVRMGARGCIVAWQGRTAHVQGHDVVPCDTNGAGDAHIGAFVASLARGDDPVRAALYANVAAALATTRFGPATAPDLATITANLRLREAS